MTLTSGALSLIKTRQPPPNERHIMIAIFLFVAPVAFFFTGCVIIWHLIKAFWPGDSKPQAEYMTTNLKPHWDN